MTEHSMCQPGRPRPQGDSHDVSSPGLFAFQRAKSRGSSLSGFGSCSSTWSGRWPESRPYPGSRATQYTSPSTAYAYSRSMSCSMKRTISGTISLALGWWSGIPRPKRPVSSRYHAVTCSASSALAPGAAS